MNIKKTKEQSYRKKVGSSMIGYPVGDFLIRIKNAVLSQNNIVEVDSTKLIFSVAKLLKNEGYFEEVKEDGGKLVVKLAIRRKEPVILGIKLISTPGLRIYKSVRELEAVKGPSDFIISTPKGVMMAKKAKKSRLGGEVIAEIL